MNVALPIVMFLVGFAAGGGIVWLLLKKTAFSAREQERNVTLAEIRVAEERVTAKDASIADLRADIQAKDRLLELRIEDNVQLKNLNAVLQTNLTNEERKTVDKLKLLDDVEEQFVAKLSEPVKETLERLNTKITVVNESATNLGQETSKLVKALQKPEVRGQWGEMHLLRVVEVTGMTDRCDFHEQQVINDEDRQQRPDLVVHLPGNRNLAVDAKAPIRAFLEAAEAADEETRQAKLGEFVRHVRDRVKLLGNKNYHQNLDNSPEFVVLYLPTEAVYSAALSCDAGLLEFATQYKVRLAGPMNLMSLLQMVAFDWKQDAVANNAREICTLAEELYKRIAIFGGHVGKLGDQLNRSVKAYNDAIGSLESRIMPQARRFEQLGAAPTDGRIEELTPVDLSARSVQCAEFAIAHEESAVDDPMLLARPR